MSKRARCHIAASFWSLSSLSSYYSHRRRSGDMSLISRKRGRNSFSTSKSHDDPRDSKTFVGRTLGYRISVSRGECKCSSSTSHGSQRRRIFAERHSKRQRATLTIGRRFPPRRSGMGTSFGASRRGTLP